MGVSGYQKLDKILEIINIDSANLAESFFFTGLPTFSFLPFPSLLS
jgi:hypothetical protein